MDEGKKRINNEIISCSSPLFFDDKESLALSLYVRIGGERVNTTIELTTCDKTHHNQKKNVFPQKNFKEKSSGKTKNYSVYKYIEFSKKKPTAKRRGKAFSLMQE